MRAHSTGAGTVRLVWAGACGTVAGTVRRVRAQANSMAMGTVRRVRVRAYSTAVGAVRRVENTQRLYLIDERLSGGERKLSLHSTE